MFFLIQYARVMHGIRRFLSRKGLLQRLDTGARESDGGLWFRSLFSVLDFEDFQTLDTPWWTLASGRKVRDFLASTPNARVLEWGSGASTVWLGKRSSEVFSIESDAAWANMVKSSIPPHVHLVTPGIPVRVGRSGISSRRMGFRHLDFSHYVGAIDDVPGLFDLIVIDGRAREACLDKALTRLTPGGIILFDNTNRLRYRAALARYKSVVSVNSDIGLTPILMWPSRTSIVWLNSNYAASGDEERTVDSARS
jgi:hypothetical protein